MHEHEFPVLFDCQGEQLLGVISMPQGQVCECGVLIVVGGPQYRIGAHRQFVLLARYLAAQRITAMRFDYRGMGDATGEMRSFEHVSDDIRAAADAFRTATGIQQIILWGLCDGASAACFYAGQDSQVVGLALANPWVRTEASVAKTYLKHYYLQRLTDPAFWKKFFTGGVSVFSSLGGFLTSAKTVATVSRSEPADTLGFPEKMAVNLMNAKVPLLILLSGEDYVAKEFRDTANTSQHWKRVFGTLAVTVHELEGADHTFSSRIWCDDAAARTVSWITSTFSGESLLDRGEKRV